MTEKPAFRNTNLPVADRLDDLLSRMSLGEKIGQICNDAPAISRLGMFDPSEEVPYASIPT
ncbi:MAG: hypothetical protein ACOC0A_01770, partial [Planctomycetota bacterium]